jgi:hypothetical protein
MRIEHGSSALWVMRIALCSSRNGTNGVPIVLTFNLRDKRGRPHRQGRPPRHTRSPNEKKPWHNSQGEFRSEIVCGALLGGGNYLVELSKALLVLSEHDIDFRVGRNGNHHAAVGVEIHDF